MKDKIILIVILTNIMMTGKAQDEKKGLFLSVNDYKADHISIPITCEKKKKAIRVSDFFLRPYVTFYTSQGKQQIPINQVFAFRDCRNHSFRIWNQKAYRICDTSALKIYSLAHWRPDRMQALRSPHFHHVDKYVTDYFFSRNDSSEIIPLTCAQLVTAFEKSEGVVNLIHAHFGDNRSLKEKCGDQFLINYYLTNYHNK